MEELMVKDETIEDLQREIAKNKKTLGQLREEQVKAAAQVGDLKNSFGQKLTARQRLEIQIDELEEQTKACKIELEILEAANKQVLAETDVVRACLKRVQDTQARLSKSSCWRPAALTDAVAPSTQLDHRLPPRPAPEQSSNPHMQMAEILQLVRDCDGAREAIARARADGAADVIEKEQQLRLFSDALRAARVDYEASDAAATSALTPHAQMAAIPSQVHVMARQTREVLEGRIKDVAEKTVNLDSERNHFETERAKIMEEQQTLREACTALMQIKSDTGQSAAECRAKTEDLRAQRAGMQALLEKAEREKDSLARTQDAVLSELESLRSDRDNMRSWTWQELSSARTKYAETSRVRERAMLDQEMHQKQLVCLATAHSQLISAGGGALTLGLEGSGGLMDPMSQDARSALMKASLVLPRTPPGRTPRSDFRSTGQQVLGGSFV